LNGGSVLPPEPWPDGRSRPGVDLGRGTPYSNPEKEGAPGSLKIVGMPVEEAAKIFRRAAYGQVFPSFE
jgi:hypothetical protein